MINRRIVILMLATAVVASAQAVFAQSSRRIHLTQLEDMFVNMRAKTKWDVDGPLLWGYFFLDPSDEKLKRAATELQSSGYRVVSIQQTDAKKLFRLHVERVEVHTPMSLHFRNNELYALAEKQGLASYDGMDVGPAPAGSK
jgi:hypothetical protein